MQGQFIYLIFLSFLLIFLSPEFLLGQTNTIPVQGNSSASSLDLEEKESSRLGLNDVASDPNTFTSDLNDKKNTSNTDYVVVWVKLFLFLGLFLVASFFITKFIKSKNKVLSQKNDYFEVMGEIMIDINKKLKIVKILNSFYVLGISMDGVNLICRIENKEDIDLLELKGNIDNNSSEGNFFKDIVNNYFNSKKNLNSKSNSYANKTGNQFFNALNITRNLRKKLDKM